MAGPCILPGGSPPPGAWAIAIADTLTSTALEAAPINAILIRWTPCALVVRALGTRLDKHNVSICHAFRARKRVDGPEPSESVRVARRWSGRNDSAVRPAKRPQ